MFKKESAMFWYVFVLLVATIGLSGCGKHAPSPALTPTMPSIAMIVNPNIEDVVAGQTVAISVDASGQGLRFNWIVARGTLSASDTPAVIYTAPDKSGVDTVTLEVSSVSGTITKNKSFNVIVLPTITPSPTSTPTPSPSATLAPSSTFLADTPTSTAVFEAGLPTIADFNNCMGTNNLGGAMGAAYAFPDSFKESYVEVPNRGCVAKLEYHIKGWSSFWMKLQGANLVSPYKLLAFDIRGDKNEGIPQGIKVELKRACDEKYDNCHETSIKRISGINDEWQTIFIDLANLEPFGTMTPLSSLTQLGQLLFTFEADRSGTDGVVYLDNIRVVLNR